MAEVWIADASPLVVLAKTGNLDLLRGLCASVIVPPAVAKEVLAGREDDPARKALETGWGVRSEPTQIPGSVREWGLGPGEEAVLAEALRRPGAVALLDDAQGRRAAKTLRIPVRGTLGVLLLAKQRGLIPSFTDAVANLTDAGFYVDQALVSLLSKAARDTQ